jgi:hypothetical protein
MVSSPVPLIRRRLGIGVAVCSNGSSV